MGQITISYPDAMAQRIVDALKSKWPWPKNPDHTDATLTPAQTLTWVKEAFRQYVIQLDWEARRVSASNQALQNITKDTTVIDS